MKDIEKLEDILHREKLKENEKHIGIPSWDRKFNELAISLGHGDLAKGNYRKITDYNMMLKIEREHANDELELYFLDRAKKMLFLGSMYPFALLIILFYILSL